MLLAVPPIPAVSLRPLCLILSWFQWLAQGRLCDPARAIEAKWGCYWCLEKSGQVASSTAFTLL